MSTVAPAASYFAFVLVCVVWGTTYAAIRIGLETIPPALLGGLRFTAAGVVLAAVLAWRGERTPHVSHWPWLALVGILMVGVGNGCVILAEQWVPSGIAAVCVATTPFWMIGVEASTSDGDRMSGWTLGGLLVGFSGILLLVWPGVTAAGGAGQRFLAGVLLLQAACVGWSVGSVVSRRRMREGSPLVTAAMQMAFGGLFMLIAGTIRGEWAQLEFTQRTLVAELYLTVVGSLVGYSAYTYALKYLPVATVSLYAYANPVVAVVLGAVLVGELLGPRVVAAGLMVLAGSALVQWKGRAAWCVVLLLALPMPVLAQQTPGRTKTETFKDAAQFVGGAAVGFAAHESGHLVLDLAFGASPGIKKVSAGFIPFFAITHDAVSPVQEFAISSAGFWVQHATSEVVLSRRPDLRHEDAAVAKGLLAFNVLTSVVYAGAAFARQGPPERDTRGMSVSAYIDEPWVGVSILAPAVLDAARYYRPRSRWLTWGSRASKVAGALLIFKAVN